MWSKYTWFSTPAFVFALLISVLTADVLARTDVVTASKPYILTPKPSQKPRINGAKIFGVRPGRPFLFTIPATGKRPIVFSAEGLPQGLKLDKQTGRITGSINTRGTYQVRLQAENALGSFERKFQIVVGDKTALTPPMGWNSWNCWACAVDDEKVRATAKAMVDTGLINHGWSYINIDDCWIRTERRGSDDPNLGPPVRDESGDLIPNAKFPDMKALCDYIHGLGLKAGIYIGPGPTTCQGYVASWEHELQDAKKFAEWGFDYLKYDWCGYSSVSGRDTLEDLQRPYILMRKMLDKVDRDIVYSICQYGWGEVWKWGEGVGGNLWRTTDDITDAWESMATIGFTQSPLAEFAGPGHWNDPDMLVVGQVGWGPKLRPSRLTHDEQYTHISLWCLLSAPLLIGCDLSQLDDFTLSLLTNDEVLEVNQDSLGDQAEQVSKHVMQAGSTEVWAKKMEDGSRAVGLFNLSLVETKVRVGWPQLGIERKQIVRDLWRQKDLGVFESGFETKVPIHGVVLVKITPVSPVSADR